jgi:uncharacterized protein
MRKKQTTAALEQRVAEINTDQLAADLNAGQLTLRDILSQLTRPGRDPREDLPQPIFKRGVLKLEDLQTGMELMGSVLNVVDFGAFVDIGLHDSGLVHVSQLANRFVRDPHDVVSVGDIVKVWVMEIDKTRRRVSLTMIAPGTPKHEPRPKHPRGEQQQGEGQRQDRPPRRERPPRRPRPAAGAPAGAPANVEGAAAVPATGDGPPRHGNRPHFDQRRPRREQRGGKPPHKHGQFQPKPKPKPLIKISDAMKKGKEPLRTFGDLLQFQKFQEGGDEALTALGVIDPKKQKQKPKPKPAPQAKPAEASEVGETSPQPVADGQPPAETSSESAAPPENIVAASDLPAAEVAHAEPATQPAEETQPSDSAG